MQDMRNAKGGYLLCIHVEPKEERPQTAGLGETQRAQKVNAPPDLGAVEPEFCYPP